MNPTRVIALAWMGLCGTMAAAIALWIAPELGRERDLLTQAHDAYARANDNEARVRDAWHIQEARRRAAGNLHEMEPPDDRRPAMPEALRLLGQLQDKFGITVTRIDPDDEARQANAGRALTIECLGTYRAVLRSIAELSRGPALLRVTSVRVQRANDVASSVDAVVHVISYDRLNLP
jgi:hypothetical protein